MSDACKQLDNAIRQRIDEVVFGVGSLSRMLTIALVADGHVLLQGVPGLGKTLLSKTLARLQGGSFRRVQCTADLMPADIIGVNIYDKQAQRFDFKPGPLFADVVLVDEINRTGPKTQSALLEAMEERQVTVDGETFPLPEGFFVIATQNPREFEGTYPLPESQLDRFLLQIDMDYPQRDDERRILKCYSRPGAGHGGDNEFGQPDTVAVIDKAQLAQARQQAAAIHVADEIHDYVLDIITATRQHRQISLGLSSRGALALLRCAMVEATIRGAEFVTPDDVKAVGPAVMAHRLMLTPEAMLEGVSQQAMVAALLDQITVPRAAGAE